MQRILSSCLLLVPCLVFGQQTKLITINNTPLSYKPKLFHVVSVKDIRLDTTNVGTIQGAGRQKVTYNFSNGLSQSLMSYINKNVRRDTAAYPIEVHFKRLELVKKNENKKDFLYLYGKFEVLYDSSVLYRYDGFTSVLMQADIATSVNGLLRFFLERSFNDCDDFLENNKDNIIKGVDVEVIIAKESNDSNEVMYNINQPLSRDYFHATPTSDERVYFENGLKYDYHYDYELNRKKVKFTIKPYMRKDRSWITSPTDTTDLNFFQVVYDIDAVKACELFGLARTTSFSYDNVLKEFESLFLLIKDSLDETIKAYDSSFDKKYDYETMVSKHNEWAIKVKKQLVNCACYQ